MKALDSLDSTEQALAQSLVGPLDPKSEEKESIHSAFAAGVRDSLEDWSDLKMIASGIAFSTRPRVIL